MLQSNQGEAITTANRLKGFHRDLYINQGKGSIPSSSLLPVCVYVWMVHARGYTGLRKSAFSSVTLPYYLETGSLTKPEVCCFGKLLCPSSSAEVMVMHRAFLMSAGGSNPSPHAQNKCSYPLSCLPTPTVCPCSLQAPPCLTTTLHLESALQLLSIGCHENWSFFH